MNIWSPKYFIYFCFIISGAQTILTLEDFTQNENVTPFDKNVYNQDYYQRAMKNLELDDKKISKNLIKTKYNRLTSNDNSVKNSNLTQKTDFDIINKSYEYLNKHLEKHLINRAKQFTDKKLPVALQSAINKNFTEKFYPPTINTLNPELLPYITPEIFTNLKTEQIRNLFQNTELVKKLTKDQVEKILPDKLAAVFTGTIGSKLSNFFSFSKNKIQTLPQEFLEKITPNQAEAILKKNHGTNKSFWFKLTNHLTDYVNTKDIQILENKAQEKEQTRSAQKPQTSAPFQYEGYRNQPKTEELPKIISKRIAPDKPKPSVKKSNLESHAFRYPGYYTQSNS